MVNSMASKPQPPGQRDAEIKAIDFKLPRYSVHRRVQPNCVVLTIWSSQ